uniref:Uncharacterized protein n=1 Tax=viral metagenome TaxID=1070528 RepID=A0A6M3L3W3_9ZZZZ
MYRERTIDKLKEIFKSGEVEQAISSGVRWEKYIQDLAETAYDLVFKPAQVEAVKAERERIRQSIEDNYLGFGASKNYSKTARYAVAKEIVLMLLLGEALSSEGVK